MKVDLSDFMIRLRSIVGMSQDEFAATLGVSRSYVAAIESGARAPNVLCLWHVRQRYGVSIDALFDGLELKNN